MDQCATVIQTFIKMFIARRIERNAARGEGKRGDLFLMEPLVRIPTKIKINVIIHAEPNCSTFPNGVLVYRTI